MADDLWLTEEERIEERRERADEGRADEDLAFVLQTMEGRRFVLRLLRRWGAEGPVQPGGEALRNEAEFLLADCARVNPKACIALCAALRNIIL